MAEKIILSFFLILISKIKIIQIKLMLSILKSKYKTNHAQQPQFSID